MEPTGNARAFNFNDEPLIRMRNTYISPGDMTDEELDVLIDNYLLGNIDLPPNTPDWIREIIELS